MMKNCYLLILFLVCFSSCRKADKIAPLAKNGYLDLSEWDFEKGGDIRLDGTWQFYWNKLYTPQDFHNDSLKDKLFYLNVPGVWNSLVVDSKNLSGQGFGTYHLKIKLKRAYSNLGIKLMDAASSYKLWINNDVVATNGEVSSVLSEIKPQMIPQVKIFNVDLNEADITVQVANNFHYKGGLWESIRIGTSEQMINAREDSVTFTMFLAGTLFILFIYHLWIFFFRKKEKAALWFGIMCLFVLVRALIINERLTYFSFPDFSLNIGYRIEYLTLFSLAFLFGSYFFNLFERSYSKTALKIITSIVLVETAIILFTPTPFYTSIVIPFQIIMYAGFIYFFILTFRLTTRGEKGAVLLLLSWLAVLIAGMNDILYLNLIVNTGQFAHYAFFVFLLTQAYILSYKISDAFNTVEDLSVNLEHKVEERTRELEVEKKKSDDLLLNILPAETAVELKQHGRAAAKTYGMVTVMFTDFKDFTDVSEKVSPELLVAEIDYCFSGFDEIIQKYGVEKIKTVGDAYICVGGMPVLSFTHAVDTVNAAIEIRNFMLERKKEKEARGEIAFEIRIGLHTGPVVAGIVGVKKFAYDIWGDTVNLAARMESHGEAGRINISGATYQLVKDKFNCTHRGKIQAKNKGEVDMYFVEHNEKFTVSSNWKSPALNAPPL